MLDAYRGSGVIECRRLAQNTLLLSCEHHSPPIGLTLESEREMTFRRLSTAPVSPL